MALDVVTHGTDIGPVCRCKGTIYAYQADGTRQVLGQCVGCGLMAIVTVDHPMGPDADVRAIRAAHVKCAAFMMRASWLNEYQAAKAHLARVDTAEARQGAPNLLAPALERVTRAWNGVVANGGF